MTVGPLIMAVGLLWIARIPADSAAVAVRDLEAVYLAAFVRLLHGLLPYYLIFGVGVSIMVAPLTTALMRSVPGRQAGLASAINNAISRVGPQLAGALIFIVITASFYVTLGDARAGTGHRLAAGAADIPPISAPAPTVPPDQVGCGP